ncbi:MAG: 1-acyl-sn-glycerol-3-phosphate acyltransferase [Candidatus Solibacter usitatus]|nr:1-acyl-sn-glycerol-3-phosphate acyltransferase [Candidatus Solibacter usitatus]
MLISTAVVTSVFQPWGRWQEWLYRTWGATVLAIFGARVRVRGAENLAPGQHYIVVSNHLSLVDTPVMVRHLPMPVKFLAKRELLKAPFIGWYINRAGHLTVDRASPRSAITSMNEGARLVREKRLSVMIFAEGTRSMDGEMQPFKDGAAYLAIQSGAPLAPVALVGTWDILPAKSSHFRGGEVEVRIGTPVSPEGYTLKQRGELTELLEERVRALMSA